MFPFPIARPQGCDIQTFYGSAAAAGSTRNARTWNKPVGVSHVYMMLIGGGGRGDGTFGGGSGGVTVWYGAAQHVPNSLLILCATGIDTTATTIQYRGTSLVTLLSANSVASSTGAAAVSATAFAASGFYQSIAGQDGSSTDPGPSATTFLGGGGGSTVPITANYGYTNDATAINAQAGFFQMQPIIVGVGNSKNGVNTAIGCGNGTLGAAGVGGPGMVLIASW